MQDTPDLLDHFKVNRDVKQAALAIFAENLVFWKVLMTSITDEVF